MQRQGIKGVKERIAFVVVVGNCLQGVANNAFFY
jgi:hypothetical protein